jgi:hypothetical protein
MRIKSNDISRSVYFIAVDATDYITRELILSNIYVYYSIDGGDSAPMGDENPSSPPVEVVDTINMPGVFKLAINELSMVTLPSGAESVELILHITADEMADVDLSIEIFDKVDVGQWLGTACATPTVAGVPSVDLAATGLDNISPSEPSGRAATFREMIVQTWMRFFNKIQKTETDIVTSDADGTDVTTQAWDDTNDITTVNKSADA